MAEENGKPKVGCSARLLGVQPGIDIGIEQMPRDWLDEQGYLRLEAERNPSGEPVTVAIRNTDMNVSSLAIESLPAFRRPTVFGGTGKDLTFHVKS